MRSLAGAVRLRQRAPIKLSRGREVATRQSHKLKIGGSNPSPATII